MHRPLKSAFELEMNQALVWYYQFDFCKAFYHAERAHILGQAYVWPHFRSHWLMMRIGWQQGDYKQVTGQLPRLLASLFISKIWVPAGNTGGVNVSPLRQMPIPEDLRELLNQNE